MRKIWIIITVFVFLLIPGKTFAFNTQAGFRIPQDEYEKLSLFYTPEYIATMSYDEYLYFQSLEIIPENIIRISKYYKVVTNNITKEVDREEITEREYEEYEVPENNRSYYFETAYQKMVLTLAHNSDTSNYFSYTGIWKTMPSVRSYDDIGGRFIGFNIVSGSQTGHQIYKKNGVINSVDYSWGGTNSQYFDNGYGISMNLVNDDITELQCTTSAAMTVDFYPAFVFGAYEHATDYITLSQAQDYTIGNGAGNVFIFGSTATGHYDGMNGISTYVTS